MKFAPKVIAIFFFLIMTLFTFHQFYIGNPFKDEIHPAWILFLFWLVSITGIILAFWKKKKS